PLFRGTALWRALRGARTPRKVTHMKKSLSHLVLGVASTIMLFAGWTAVSISTAKAGGGNNQCDCVVGTGGDHTCSLSSPVNTCQAGCDHPPANDGKCK